MSEKQVDTGGPAQGPNVIELSKHTSLPWRSSPIYGNGGLRLWAITHVEDLVHTRIADVPLNGPQQEANAEFIVRAVNSHYEIAEALKQVQEALSLRAVNSWFPIAVSITVEAALTKAQRPPAAAQGE